MRSDLLLEDGDCLTEGKKNSLLKAGKTINLELWGKLPCIHLPYQIRLISICYSTSKAQFLIS